MIINPKLQWKNILYFLFIVLLMPSDIYGQMDRAFLKKIVSDLEIELTRVGYDISKLSKPQVGTPVAIMTLDYKMVYPRISDLSEARDYDGRQYVREIVEKAVAADGEFIRYEYRWKNKYDPQILSKLYVGKYIKKHNLIIGAAEVVDLLEPSQSNQ